MPRDLNDMENNLNENNTPEVVPQPEIFVGKSVDASLCPEQGGTNKGWTVAAHTVSWVFCPLFMPVYSILILLYGNTVMSLLPIRTKLFLLSVVALNTLVIPLLFIGFLKTSGRIKKVNLHNRTDRMLPLLAAAICYFICAYMVNGFMVAFVIRKILIAGAMSILFAAAITSFWKISLHMVGVGGALAIIILIAMSNLGSLFPWVIVLVMASGLVASARLFLGCHTPKQVAAGFFAGFIISSAVMLI